MWPWKRKKAKTADPDVDGEQNVDLVELMRNARESMDTGLDKLEVEFKALREEVDKISEIGK